MPTTEVSRQNIRLMDAANMVLTAVTYDDGSKAVLAQSTPGDDPWLVEEAPVTPIGVHQQNTNLTAAVTLTPPVGANIVWVQVTGAPVRYTISEGSTPTSTLGGTLVTYAEKTFFVGTGYELKFIRQSEGAIIDYQWGHVNVE